MDDSTLLIAAACAVLALLVYMMYRSAVKEEWRELAVSEKKRWRNEEEGRKQKAG